MKLPSYVREIRQGRLRPAAQPFVVSETNVCAVVDGAATFGQVGASFASDLAIEKAGVAGLALVTASHCHHTGRIGEWVERITSSGLIGMAMCGEAHPPRMVAPHGGAKGALATNPMAWAIPRGPGRAPLLLDYATSAVSIGKLQVARARDEDIPEGWILDAAGSPSSELADFFSGGVLMPFGGHMGYALGVVVELLTVALSSGDRFPSGERSSCLLILVVDPERFRRMDEFTALTDAVADRLKAVPARDGFREVLLPGEPETRSRAERATGVPVPDSTWQTLLATAHEVGVVV
jgi:uncharacterized oxidoreductase